MLQRCFTRIAQAIIIAMIPLAAPAQQYFDFGADAYTPRANVPVVVFFADDQLEYTVTTTVKDMVFDAQGRYSQQHMAEVFTPKHIDVSTGFFHTRMFPYNRNVSGDVADKFGELLGCGTYHFKLSGGTIGNDDFEFDLDLTDARWASGQDNHFRNILITPDYDGNNWGVIVQISVETKLSTQLIDCGRYDGSERIRYWELIRFHGGTWTYYERVRNGFSIAPSVATPDPNGDVNPSEVPYNYSNVPNQTLVVNTEVTDNITVPAGCTFTVGTEPVPLNSAQETMVLLHPDKGITIQAGGKLISENSGPSGFVTWRCAGYTFAGAWTGIRALPGSEIDFRESAIKYAVKGLVLDNATATLAWSIIDSSSHIGLEIIECSPQVTFCDIAKSGRVGTQNRGANVFITGTGSAPQFSNCVFAQALKSETGGAYYGGNGVEITGTDVEASFNNCSITENDSCGFNIHQTHGPRIDSCWIAYNGHNMWGCGVGPVGAGIFVNRGSFWTTLQHSRVIENTEHGISLAGLDSEPAKLRGWWHPLDNADPGIPAIVDEILAEAPWGMNCIVDNGINIYSPAAGIYDLGVPYLDGNNNTVNLGGQNSLYQQPARSQVDVNNNSDAHLRANYWNGNYQIFPDFTSVADYSDEIGTDLVNCMEGSRSAKSVAGSVVRTMFDMRRASWSGQRQVGTSSDPTFSAPMTAVLSAAFPNPFNPTIQLDVTVAVTQGVHLSIFDSRGRQIAVLADKSYDFGTHTFTFDASALPSGTYYAVLRTVNGSVSRALTLLK